MSRILLLLDHRENSRLLTEWLSLNYKVLQPQNCLPMEMPFDLCILDPVALKQHHDWVEARKRDARPGFLPFLLVTSRQALRFISFDLRQSVNELVTTPIEKAELHFRIAGLLQTRQLSLELQQRHQDLQAAIASVQTEIADRQRAEAELRSSEARFRSLSTHSPVGIFLTNLAGDCTYTNPSCQDICGLSAEASLGKGWLSTVHPEDREATEVAWSAFLQAGQPYIQELRLQLSTGLERWVIVRSSPLVAEDGSLIGHVGTLEDISERKQAEIETKIALQKEKELNILKSRFISMVSHEFRNPMTSILLSVNLIERFYDALSTERRQNYLQRIRETIAQMTTLLDDVLEIGRADAGRLEFEPTSLDLAAFCQSLAEESQFTAGQQHAIAYAYQGPQEPVHMDAKLLRQMLTNLLANAVKYSPKGGTVTFSVICKGDTIIFRIQDQGIGIPLDDQAQLFEPFRRANNVGKIPGTGLGLAIVKRCVDLHQGQITVESQVGTGTTFAIALPCHPTEASDT